MELEHYIMSVIKGAILVGRFILALVCAIIGGVIGWFVAQGVGAAIGGIIGFLVGLIGPNALDILD